jgi:glycerol-3-phosphate cytidylyltransferase-like family protein
MLNVDENSDIQRTIPDQQTAEEDTETKVNRHHAAEEKVPQIEEEVLHLLPLPQLSKEIPPTLIHKKPSFEKSMYGDKPLTSARPASDSESGSRFSRFSMTEEDYLAMKKKEEEEKRKSLSFIAVPKLEDQHQPASSTPKNDELSQNTLEIVSTDIDNVSQLTVVSQDPLSSTLPVKISKDDQKRIQEDSKPTQKKERRASIVSTAAHSLLGDKLDDFTEKLAFIKKNIIMSADSEEEDEEVDNAESMLKKIEESKLTKTNRFVGISYKQIY